MGEVNIPVVDLPAHYSKLSDLIELKANLKSSEIGIKFSNVNIENISLPEEVEKLIDEQTGIGMASQDMEKFIQYQSARAIRDAANQSGGVAGLGASIVAGKHIADVMDRNFENDTKKIKCENCSSLNEEKDKFCHECGEMLKQRVKETIKDEAKKEAYEKLREYKALLDENAITEEEYEAIKDKLLK